MSEPRMELRVLGSGSSGNCVYVRVGETRVLIDAGLSLKRVRGALAEVEASVESLDAILLTHEHSDHTSGLGRLLSNSEAVLHTSAGTIRELRRRGIVPSRKLTIGAGWPVRIGCMHVTPFATSHDAADSLGFRIESEGSALGYATDLGRVSSEVRHGLFDCQVLVLEANHDPQLLAEGSYPPWLKRRVASDRGHLSNEQARLLLKSVAGPRLEHVVLAHLSDENNTPGHAIETVSSALTGAPEVGLSVAAPEQAGALLAFGPSEARGRPSPPPRKARQAELPFAHLG